MVTNRTLTREESEKRTEQDTGNEDDIVYVSRRKNGNKISSRPTYHDDLCCPQMEVNGLERELTRSGAKKRWKSPCKSCTLAD